MGNAIVDVLFYVAVFGVAGAVIAITVVNSTRSRPVLEQWARAQGLKIIEAHRRILLPLSLFFAATRSQIVYRIRVQDSTGLQRDGWAICGGPLSGLFSPQVKVHWDKLKSNSIE